MVCEFNANPVQINIIVIKETKEVYAKEIRQKQMSTFD